MIRWTGFMKAKENAYTCYVYQNYASSFILCNTILRFLFWVFCCLWFLENLSHLRPCPGSLSDKQRQSDSDGSARVVAERPKAARRRQEEELRKRKLETRVKVIQEVIQTEHDYLQSLCLCLETFFNSDTVCYSVRINYHLRNADKGHKEFD